MAPSRTQALGQLRAQWALFLLIGFASIAGAWLLQGTWLQADVWAAVSTGMFVYQVAVLWFDLPLHAAKGAALRPRFGAGTWVSLLRLLLLSTLAGFLATVRPEGAAAWLPFAICLVFNVGDLVDGYLARVSSSSTRLGEKLDLDLDGRGVLVASLLAIRYDATGWWYAFVGLARYAYVFGLWLRARRGLAFKQFENPLRRPLAGIQMGVTAALLAPSLPRELPVFASTLSMLPFLGNFLLDWLVGVGWMRYTRFTRSSVLDAGLLFARVGILALLVLLKPTSDLHLLQLALAGALLLGFGGRLAAFALLVVTAIGLQGQTIYLTDYALVFCGLLLLYMGCGRFVLRAADEAWFFQRQGARKRP